MEINDFVGIEPPATTEESAPERYSGHTLELTVGWQTARVRLAGEIDSASAPDLTRLLTSLDRLYSMTIEVDLAGVTFLDTAGVEPLVEATRHRRDQNLPPVFIGACSSSASWLMHLARLDGGPSLDIDAWDELSRWAVH